MGDTGEIIPIPGGKTPVQESNGMRTYPWLFKLGCAAAFLFQTVWGLLCLINLVTAEKKSPLTNSPRGFNVFALFMTFDVVMGAVWLYLVGVIVFGRNTLNAFAGAYGLFLTYYTVFYVLGVAWVWSLGVDIDNQRAYIPGDQRYLSYLALQIYITVGTLFFDVYCVAALTAEATEPSAKKRPTGLLPGTGNTKTAMLIFGIVTIATFLALGIWSILFVVGYDMGKLVIPVVLFGIFGGCGVLTCVLYLVVRNNRQGSKTVAMSWNLPFYELDKFAILVFATVVLNLAFWSVIGAQEDANLDHAVTFSSLVGRAFYQVLGISLINAILFSFFVYHGISFVCYSLEITEIVPGDEVNVMRWGFDTLFGWFSMAQAISDGSPDQTQVGVRRSREISYEAPAVLMRLLMALGFFYELISFLFIFYDLIGNLYVANHFASWMWSAIAIQGFFAIVILCYSCVTLARLEDPVNHQSTIAAFVRPMVTLLITLVLEISIYITIYQNHVSNGKVDSDVTDPTKFVHVLYYSALTLVLGMLLVRLFCWGDLLSVMYGGDLKEPSKVTYANTDKGTQALLANRPGVATSYLETV